MRFLTVLISSCVKEINVILKERTIHIGIFYTCLLLLVSCCQETLLDFLALNYVPVLHPEE
jgi:hypothetical protein